MNTLLIFLRLLLATLLTMPSMLVSAQSPQPEEHPGASQPQAASNPGQPNALTMAAVQRGALACASRVEQVSQFLGFGAGAGALLLTAPVQPDSHLFDAVMELRTAAGGSYASASFVALPGSGCEASYDAVSYSPQSCEVLADKQFKGLRKVGALAKDVVVLDGGQLTKVFLLPAGSGCVSIKKQLVF